MYSDSILSKSDALFVALQCSDSRISSSEEEAVKVNNNNNNNNNNKNLCGRDGRTICGPQRVSKSTCVSL